jgi:hypothetical protein
MLVPKDEDGDADAMLDDETPTDPVDGTTDKVSRMLSNLTMLGVPLPDDTDQSNIIDRLDVALGLLVTMKQQQETAKQQQAVQNQPRADQQSQPKEAPMPSMMMSALPPIAQEIVKRDAKRLKEARLAKIESLKARGLSIVEANRLTIAASSVSLSLDAKGQLTEAEVDRQIALLDRILPAADSPQALLSSVNPDVKEVPSPAESRADAEYDPETRLVLTPAEKADIRRRADQQLGRAPQPAPAKSK